MSMLARQISEVLEVYASRRSTWLVGGLLTAAVLLITYVEAFHGAPGGSLDNTVIAAYLRCMFLAALFTDQVAWQFTHSRARLLPRFALPHLAFPVLIALVAGILLPAGIAAAQHTSMLQLAALNSAVFGLVLVVIYSASWVLGWAVLLPLLPSFLGYDFDDIRLDWSMPTSIAVLTAGWMVTAYCFWRLAQLHEESRAYERLQAVSCRGRRKRAGWRDQVWFLHSWNKSPPSWRVADLWNDRIGGYHQGNSARVVRLLQHGFGPKSPGLDALRCCGIMFLAALVVTYGEATEDIRAPLETARLIPVLIFMAFPAGLAVDKLARRRPVLAREILLPLSREQLIDSLIHAAAWRAGLLWLAGNAIALPLLRNVPELAPSFWRLATYLFLSAAITFGMFGHLLVAVLWDLLASRILAMVTFLAVGLALMLLWWFNRDYLSDVPFWIAGGLMLAFGRAMYRSGRRDWLNLELGGKIPD